LQPKTAGLVVLEAGSGQKKRAFEANDRRDKMNVLPPAVDVNAYRAKRQAQAQRAVERRAELGSLEHSFVQRPELTPWTPRVVTTARNEHPRQDGRRNRSRSRSSRRKADFPPARRSCPALTRMQARQLAALRKIAEQPLVPPPQPPQPQPPSGGPRSRTGGGRNPGGRSHQHVDSTHIRQARGMYGL
jgi:hypothetical protein